VRTITGPGRLESKSARPAYLHGRHWQPGTRWLPSTDDDNRTRPEVTVSYLFASPALRGAVVLVWTLPVTLLMVSISINGIPPAKTKKRLKARTRGRLGMKRDYRNSGFLPARGAGGK
jgi:hypothetical protein